LGENDRLVYRGSFIPLDVPLPFRETTELTIRRAVSLEFISGQDSISLLSSAMTVAQALEENGIPLYAGDFLDPPASTPIRAGMTITHRPAIDLTIHVDGRSIQARAADATVEEALAEVGIPLIGMDESEPGGSSPLPEDGQITVRRIDEVVEINTKSLPYDTRADLSAELEIDQQALLHAGEPGLAVTRTIIRLEDGQEISKQVESETIVRAPQDRILGIGTKIVIRTATVDGETIEYWRVLTMNATSYSPCRSMTPSGACSYGTASGMKAGYGVVAMVYRWYLLFAFENLYIPGYGRAVVGDNGGVNLSSNYWIDLGYDDNNYVPWSQPVTVYFLTPVPANPGYVLP
jgi:uncharacterized protein YabE (DUF348 family)